MRFEFEKVTPRHYIDKPGQWLDWGWQLRSGLKSISDFENYFELSVDEKEGLSHGEEIFRSRTTPYYASLASRDDVNDPVRKILMPTAAELFDPVQAMADPLGENKNVNRPVERIIHRYSDRVLFLVTDFCSVYCRYCTRKHFTANDQMLPKESEYQEALTYIKTHAGIREVILSGGDPLTLSDSWLERVLSDLRGIEHVEIIRIGTRMPVVAPMRVTDELCKLMQAHHPVYIMTHFNHPREVTAEAAIALEKLANHGFPLFNQMVLLNGVNNHPAVVQALSRRLLYLRVKPYYMFQCDPSLGTDHLRTSVRQSKEIQKQLWGHLSGLAMPNLSLDLPDGGGKVGIVPDFSYESISDGHRYTGWDGVQADYLDPKKESLVLPSDFEDYLGEWEELKAAKGISE